MINTDTTQHYHHFLTAFLKLSRVRLAHDIPKSVSRMVPKTPSKQWTPNLTMLTSAVPFVQREQPCIAAVDDPAGMGVVGQSVKTKNTVGLG